MRLVVNKIGKLASASRKSQVSELAAVDPSRNSLGRVWLLPIDGQPRQGAGPFTALGWRGGTSALLAGGRVSTALLPVDEFKGTGAQFSVAHGDSLGRMSGAAAGLKPAPTASALQPRWPLCASCGRSKKPPRQSGKADKREKVSGFDSAFADENRLAGRIHTKN